MAKLLTWNLSRLKVKSRDLTGPLPDLYLRDLSRLVEELQGVYLSGIQVGDPRRFAIPNSRFKGFPILYNPQIIEQYDLIRAEGEGCLSFPGLWVKVPRFKYVTIRFRDGQWKEQTVTYGDDDPDTEAGLLAKVIQHEIFHMEGIVTHERITDVGKRIKAEAQILKHSLIQNKTSGIPELVEGPLEVDPSTLIVNDTNPDVPLALPVDSGSGLNPGDGGIIAGESTATDMAIESLMDVAQDLANNDVASTQE